MTPVWAATGEDILWSEMMTWLEGGQKGALISSVSHVEADWAQWRSHKTLKADADKETSREPSIAGKWSVQADSEGEGEGLVILDL